MLTENGFTFSKLILAAGRCDLRKGIDGLAAIIRLKYGLDPLEKKQPRLRRKLIGKPDEETGEIIHMKCFLTG